MAVDPRQVIEETWTRRGLDPRAGLAIAQIESGLNPNAKNPNSSASGLFQFITSTANQYGLTDPMNPYQNADAAARLYADNTASLRKVLGREPTVGEAYLAHQQGAGGAAKLLANPNARAVDVVGADAVRLNGGNENMTAGEFADLWIRKADGGGPERIYQAQAQTAPPEAAMNVYNAYKSGAMSDPAMRAEYEAAVASGAFPLPEGVQGLPQAQPAPPATPIVDPQAAQNVYDAYVSGNRMTPQIAADYEAAIANGTMPLPPGVTALPDIGGSLLPGGDGPAPIARNEGSIAAEQSAPYFDSAGQILRGETNPAETLLGNAPRPDDSLLVRGNRAIVNPLINLGAAGLQALGGTVAGVGGGIGDAAEAMGTSRGTAERLGRDMAALPEAFAGSGAALGPAGGGLPTGLRTPRTGPLGESAREAGLRPVNANAANRVAAADAAIQAGRDTGVRVMTSDALPPTTFASRWAQAIGEKIPIAGTGGPRAAQAQERTQAIENLVREYSPAGTTVDDLLPLLSRDLVGQRLKRVQQYNNNKTEVIDRLSGAGNVDVTRTVSAIDAEIARLQGLNLQGVQPVIRELQDWQRSVQGQNLSNVEMTRRIIGDAFKGSDNANVKTIGEQSLNRIYAPLREDMGDFIRTNGERQDYNKWMVANRRLSESMGELESSALRRSLRTADVNPETVRGLLFSPNRSDVQTFYNTLSPTGKKNARAAVLLEALGETKSADAGVSATRFAANARRLARQTGVVFTGQDQQALNGLERVLQATQRADQAAVNAPTGVQNVPFVGGAVLADLAGSAGAAVGSAGGLGIAARIYESPQMRNLLVGIARARAGSAQERELIRRYEQLAGAALRAGSTQEQPNGE
jgi:hypothetical protein